MPTFPVAVARRLVLAATAIVVLAAPALARAEAPGSLSELGCIQAPVESLECPGSTDGGGLMGASDVVVSPDPGGKNVYVTGASDEAVAEFARNSNGTLTQLDPPNDCIADPSNDGSSSCTAGSAGNGLVNPQAIVISPDGLNVYVAAQDFNGNGTIAELARNADGSLTPIAGHDCIAENIDTTDENSPCDDQTAFGINYTANSGIPPVALAISPDGKNLYAVNEQNEDIAVFNRASDGSLSQPDGADDCIVDATVDSECGSTATGISNVTGVAVTPDGNNVYTAGFSGGNEDGTIAEFARNADGSLTQLGGAANCIEQPGDDLGCGTTAIGVAGLAGLIVSPDGRNVYTASETFGGPIAEFSRAASGALTQLPAPNDCIQEGADFGCGSSGTGITSGYRLAISPDGVSVYAPAPAGTCVASSCSDVAEFVRNPDGTLTQLASPDSCIQDSSVEGGECPGNENGRGLGGPGVAISPDGTSVYVTGGTSNNSIAAFARTPVPKLTVSLAGSGTGAVSDGNGELSCPSVCSHAYAPNSQVTLTAAPSSGSTFAGWGGACSGTGTCQVTMSADMAVTATFTANGPSAPGAPTPVLTGAPNAVTDSGAGFSGSVNPEGLPTTVFFQYGLDKRYSQVGASGADYTAQTSSQAVGSDFAVHGVGPIAVSGLVPNALYHVRLVATNSAGTTFGQDVTFTTALAPAPPTPTLGQTFNVAPVSGLVLVLIHGHLVPLTQLEQLPPGVTIDSLHGTFRLTSAIGGGTAHDAAAKGKPGKTQTGQFGGAVVRIHQTKGGSNRGLTTVMMVESAFKGAPGQSICKAPAGDAHAAASKTIQLLHASAHGKFSTRGRYSAATVRGTKWTMTARCDGTLTHVITDSVAVTDFVRHKTIVLHAGQSYLAPLHRKK